MPGIQYQQGLPLAGGQRGGRCRIQAGKRCLGISSIRLDDFQVLADVGIDLFAQRLVNLIEFLV